MISSRDAFRAILAKDLRIELRTMRSLPAMALFAVTVFVLFHFALNTANPDSDVAAGILLVTVLFAAILAINRLFLSEREEGGFELIRLAPIDRSVLFAAKFAALFIYLAVLEAIAVPVFAAFFLDSGRGLVATVGVLLMLNAGLAATGTLVSSIATNSSARDLLTPLILLPMLIPLVIAASSLVSGALDVLPADKPGTWLAVLGLYDSIFILIGYAVFDFLLED
ncbi:MAG: heme exporter protein [Solirubrobacterales bacterium]|nr:heme exporter protein [Solirubrobacterales bacterium]